MGFKIRLFHVRKTLVLAALTTPLLTTLSPVHADQRVSGCFQLIAGMAVSTVGIHEAGHTIGALALGYPMNDIHYKLSSVDVKGLAVGSHHDKIIKMSGFAAQALSSEIIFGVDRIPKDNWFVAGMLLGNIIHPIVYGARAEFGTNARDFEGFSRKERRIAEALIVADSLLTAYRAYKIKGFPIRIQSTGQDIRLLWTKTFD
ncbi:MAG: hypothetical protein ABIN58_13540 [candidate division WOR-3 bacterium]